MAALDWIFAAVLLASMLIGAWRGLVFELLSLAGWVVAFFLAQWWAAPMAAWLPMGEAQDAVRHAAGFAVVFVLAVFACGFVAWLAKKLIEAVGLRPADRALGALFGVLRGGLITVVAVIFLGWLMPSPPTWVSESKSLPILEKLGDDLVAALPPDLEKLLTDFIKRGGDDDVEPHQMIAFDQLRPAQRMPGGPCSTIKPVC